MTDTTDQGLWVRRLRDALVLARQRGMEAAQIVDDGGTCNLDDVVLRPPVERARGAHVVRAIEAAGLRATETTWCGRGWFIAWGFPGQADKRTRAMEAARRCLEDHGFPCSMYYQMD